MNKTIEEMREAKFGLEQLILELISTFENIYGLEVGGIDLFKNHTIGCSQGRTTSVKVEVEVKI